MIDERFWSDRYEDSNIGWDLGRVSTPLQTYIDQISNKELRILIPGAGNAYEASYLIERGFQNVIILDISVHPLKQFQQKHPTFPKDQLRKEDFFEHQGCYDLILEQTFFCALTPTEKMRSSYVKKMWELLNENGKLVGVWWDFPLKEDQKAPPFGGDKEEYLSYFKSYFEVKTFEKAYNSVEERKELEFFGILKKKNLIG
ncbi:MAG: SAM-dependent methyltransferase [Flavobacteriaceae bacterium]|nr:SAM-dependent methyltransferase [Flavobacteriaceae bacterium]